MKTVVAHSHRVIQFIRGLTGESKAKSRDTALEAQLLLDVAAKLESEDRARAVEKYEEIVRAFPNSAASCEAQRNIQVLTTPKH